MLANRRFAFAISSLSGLVLMSCTLPQISKEGAQVQIVAQSNCKFVGNIMSFYKDFDAALNYKSQHQNMEQLQSQTVRERAYAMGANRVVPVFTTRDVNIQNQISFYSAHKCP